MRTLSTSDLTEQMSRPWQGKADSPAARRTLFQQITDGSCVDPAPWRPRLQNWFRTRILGRPSQFVGDRREDAR